MQVFHRFRRYLGPLFSCLLLCCAIPAAAAPARTLRFDQLSVEQGLPQETVMAIAQDRQGFMWFGSQAGLSRYDGNRVITYKSSVGEPRSLADNWVSVLHLDPDGQLWVGTDGGLDRFDAASRSFTHFQPHEPGKRGNGNRHVRAIVGDGARGFWIATADGLQHLDPASGQFTIWHHDQQQPGSLADDKVSALARDGAGRLWVGTATGLDMLEPGATVFRHFRLDALPASPFNGVQALTVDAAQNLWVGTLGGLERWNWDGAGDVPRRQRFGQAHGLNGVHVTSIYQDVDGDLWVGTYSDGLQHWQPEHGRFAPYRHLAGDRHSVADDQVAALYRDRAGTFWVGTWYSGVSRVDLSSGGFARLMKLSDRPDSLSDNKVRALTEDGHGRLWLGTNAGLNLYDVGSGAARVIRHDPRRHGGLNDDQVNALWRSPGGTLWVGGRRGLNRSDDEGRRFTSLALARGDAAGDIIRGIGGDRAGIVWVASRGGLHRIDPRSGALRTFRHDPADSTSLADDVVRPILEDRRGRLWIGTFNGLDLMDRASGRFTHFRHDARDLNSLSHDEVHCLYEDAAGTLWVGTASGLNRMDMGPDGVPRFQRFTRQNGLADDAIAAILGSGDGALWLSTNSGMAQFDPRSGQFRNYDAADGTIEGAYFDGAALRGADGTLYFGGFNGLTAFAPEAIRANNVPPLVAVTDFQIFNKSLEAGRGAFPAVLESAVEHTRAVTLSHQASVFSLEFAALHFAAPQRNRFAYRLQGFDQDWVFTDASKHFATYTNLDPGHYVFRVRAANKDGLWNERGVALSITILPPYWKTWWFRSLAALLLLGSAWAAYRARMRALERQKDRLEQQVGQRTAEVELKNQLLLEQESQVRQHTEELALANRALQENDERLRLAKQKAEDATRQKSEFLANMSHEMRTPLAGVIGMLGFALRDSQMQDATREQVLRGQANAQSLLTIINDLLDFSKIEAGKLSIENIDFALVAALDNVAGLFEEQAAAHDIGFGIELGPDLPAFVVGDPSRLRQVLVNLLGNAFKFTQRGAVTLRVERSGALPNPGGPAISLIRFSVSDTGIGIAAEAIPRLFQKFEQADSSTTRRYGGTGLGLAICRQLVELMGGTISAVSTPGAGSTFSFVLPLADGAPPALAPSPALAPHTHRLRVLCAEDFPTNQIIIRTMLEELGHRADLAANGALAVAACARVRYDLVLMDGRMPEMDGASATRLIRAGGPAAAPVRDADVTIVALTANVSDEDRARYLAAGMDDFLTKPIDPAALHAQLARVIERQLRRGVLLQPMGEGGMAGTSELDAMFGVAPAAAAPPAASLKQRIRAAFAADAGPRLAELEAALAAADGDAAACLLHGFKGSAAYLDEMALHLLCGELEAAADGGLWEPLRAGLPRLRELLAAINAHAK